MNLLSPAENPLILASLLVTAMWIGAPAIGQSADVAEGPAQAQSNPVSRAGADAPDRIEPLPEPVRGVGITQNLGAALPLDATFTNAAGKQVTLGDYFTGQRPVILALVYYNCPQMCTLILNGMNDALKELDWMPGEEYEVVVVSFDPTETPDLADLKKRTYVSDLGRAGAADGYHFLVGDEVSINRLTEAVGFEYKWDDQSEQFVHDSAIYIVTPQGNISRYLFGIYFEGKLVRRSLVEASDGQIGSLSDYIYLTCFRYDPEQGSYAASAMAIVRLGGLLTVVGVGAGIVVAMAVGRRRRARQA
jgi:protein SCO1/2